MNIIEPVATKIKLKFDQSTKIAIWHFKDIWLGDIKQDGRLATAYFSPNYKYFDQFLQTVINKTTVLILVFKEFLQINSTTDFCTLCKRVSRFSLEKFSSHSAEKFRRGTL